MHDGSLASLEAVIQFYNQGGVPNEGLDPILRPLDLDDDEVAALVAFLEALTGGNIAVLVGDALAAPIGGS
jgi:cytochrome c peroxidase